MKICLLVYSCLAVAFSTFARAQSQTPEWAGQGGYRLLVKVLPVDIGARTHDLMPADISLALTAQLKTLGADAKADLGSIQVIRYDPQTGRAMPADDGWLYGRGPNDRPFRWYDAAIPYEFPQILGAITRENGALHRLTKTRAGYFYNTLGNGDAGHLAWVHTQHMDQPSYYAIYFDVLPRGQSPSEVPPRGWVGDGMPRADRVARSTTGDDHVMITLADWDGDGLTDIVFGEQYGSMFVFLNRGTRTKPEFPYEQEIFDADGYPIDVGLHASPLVIDFDGDGVNDLVAGCYKNHVIWYRNVGSNKAPRLVYKGYVQADGKALKLPTRPVIGRSEAIFDEDYYPVLEWADWNGDGRPDLLAGGYITGRIFFFENTGRATDNTPLLKLRGPLEADGKPLNVGDWAASPCVADFDGDGKLDLVTGRFPMTPASESKFQMLRYFKNVGSKTRPVLSERPFPADGLMPNGGLADPKAVDIDGDGLLDLVVSAHENIYVFRNTGTATEPRFQVAVPPLSSRWGNDALPTRQFLDWNHDGWPDYVEGYDVHLNAAKGNPYQFDEVVSVLPPGVRIAHPSGVGDDWFWPYLCDLDRDGRYDILFGDWHGNIWYHHNLGGADGTLFDLKGVRLRTTDGKDIKVGPVDKHSKTDFQAMQGARTVFTAADFDGDGQLDLVVADTYGIVRYYRNAGTGASPVFDPPVQIADLRVRLLLDAIDWNGDGQTDIVAGTIDHQVHVLLNRRTSGPAQFDPPALLNLPPVLEPGTVAVDLNRDGDTDLFLTSTQGSVLVERSFAEHGYAPAKSIRLEKRPE